MVAELVQHQQLRAASLREPVVDVGQQDFVEAVVVAAQAGASMAETLSAGSPSHTPLQPLWLSRQRTVTPARRSTCSSDSCRGCVPRRSRAARPATNMHGSDTSVLVPQRTSREVDDRQPRQFGCGLACVATQAPVRGTRRLADHEHHDERARALRPAAQGARPARSARAADPRRAHRRWRRAPPTRSGWQAWRGSALPCGCASATQPAGTRPATRRRTPAPPSRGVARRHTSARRHGRTVMRTRQSASSGRPAYTSRCSASVARAARAPRSACVDSTCAACPDQGRCRRPA